jgi:hypothetical protein
MPGGRGATLVALTGYGHGDIVERAAANGFDHHLLEPPILRRSSACWPPIVAGPRAEPAVLHSPDRVMARAATRPRFPSLCSLR